MFILSIVNQLGQFVYAKISTDDIRDKLLVGMNLYIIDTYYTIVDCNANIFADFEAVVLSMQVKKYDGIPENYTNIEEIK